MRYLSLCSGIEAATVAWKPLGFEAVAFSEIEPAPNAVLAHHYPTVPNLGDMTRYKEWNIERPIDIMVGGTPCQSFSVAGLRKGLEDPRGNLMLTYGAIAGALHPTWLVWENVPGVLSSNGGRDFGTFLGMLGELGYGFAYRVLDAQYFGVPQRRRRVFVVGYLGDWRRAAAVLFESESLCGYPPPSREAGARVAVCPTLRAGRNGTGGDRPPGTDVDTAESLIAATLNSGGNNGGFRTEPGEHLVANTVKASNDRHRQDPEQTLVTQYAPEVSPAMKARDCKGPYSDGDGDGDGLPLIAFDTTQITHPENRSNPQPGDPAPTLPKHGHAPAIAVATVRRLTPRECERLQGFPDDYTLVSNDRGKPMADGPRYRMLGNSMAVPVMRWIGERILIADKLPENSASTNESQHGTM